MKTYNEGDIILCEVKDVVKTTVFVETLDGMKGSIVFSEVAPGRIRNIRDYVVPKKIIACKILHIATDHLFLSLRRVKDKEKKEALEVYKKERSLESFIKKLLGNKSGEIINKILSTYENITYLGSSKFTIKTKSRDLKQADSKLNKILETIEKESKKEKC